MQFHIDTIKLEHDARVCHIIKTVGSEFNAVGEGFGPGDAEVSCMSRHYHESSRSTYRVGIIKNEIVGGCGLAAFNGSDHVCELRKLFILPQSRGHKLGQALTQSCLDFAIASGYHHCYLETLSSMIAAIALYQKLGFVALKAPLAGSVHNACNVWMQKKLT